MMKRKEPSKPEDPDLTAVLKFTKTGRLKIVYLCASSDQAQKVLEAAIEITLHKAETGQFTFSKQNVTGYVKTIAKGRYQQAQKAMLEKYEPPETDIDALYS